MRILRPSLIKNLIGSMSRYADFDDGRCNGEAFVAQTHVIDVPQHCVYSGDDLGVIESRSCVAHYL